MRISVSLVCVALCNSLVASTSGAQKPPPVHFLDRPVAASKHEFKAPAVVRHLPNGKVLLNDASRRQLLLLDSSLAVTALVADSTPGSENSYGPTPAGLLPYPGDSSLLVLPRVPSMYMIDPSGKIVRVMAVPRPQDASAMATMRNGIPGFDAQGRWIYRGSTPPATRTNPVPGGPPGFITGADSAPIVRVNPTTRALDTAGMFRLSKFKGKLYPRDGGRTLAMIENNPVPMVDDWAVLSDGSIAIVRGQDYHVDFINADGSLTRGPKMAYAWEPLGDDAKLALIDSVKKAEENSRKTPSSPVSIAGGPPGTSGGGGGAGLAGGTSSSDLPPPEIVSLSDLPDYRPPFQTSAAHPDADGNLWIQTTHREPSAGAVYDVVNRQGKVVDRVQLQPGRSIIGFGRGGIVYAAASDDSGSWIEKSRWRFP